MIPTSEELISLNPRLENRSKKEIDELMNTIISKGYIWKDKEKYFYHEKMGMHIRTAGLDLFNPESFLEIYKAWSNKSIASGARLRSRYVPKLLLIFVIDLFLGWILLPLILWISSLLFLLLAMVIIYRITRKRMEKGKKEVAEMKSSPSSTISYPKSMLYETMLILAEYNPDNKKENTSGKELQ